MYKGAVHTLIEAGSNWLQAVQSSQLVANLYLAFAHMFTGINVAVEYPSHACTDEELVS